MPFSPAAELMLTRLPPRSTRWGSAAAQVFQVPIRLTSTTVRHCSGVVVSQVPDGQHAGVGHRGVQAAQFGDAVVDRRGQRRGVADIDDVRDGAAAELVDQTCRLVEIVPRGERVFDLRQRCADVDEDEVGAFFGQPHRMAAAHSPRGAGDQHPLAGDSPVRSAHSLLQKPASTGNVTPVTYLASSETR